MNENKTLQRDNYKHQQKIEKFKKAQFTRQKKLDIKKARQQKAAR